MKLKKQSPVNEPSLAVNFYKVSFSNYLANDYHLLYGLDKLSLFLFGGRGLCPIK